MRLIDADKLKEEVLKWLPSDPCGIQEKEMPFETDIVVSMMLTLEEAPSIDIVHCRECKHRPVKEDADGENYGFNIIEPNNGDERCPCLVSDGWYSWMPDDDFYCGYGER